MRTVLYSFLCAFMVGTGLFSAALCEQRRPLKPEKFTRAEYTIRLQWHEAYMASKHAGGRSRQKMPKSFSDYWKTDREFLSNLVIEVYEKGHICQAENWMTPKRFFEIVAKCKVLESALAEQDDLALTLQAYETTFAEISVAKHDNGEAEAKLNTVELEYHQFLQEQEQHLHDGLAQLTVFSIKNFATEAQFIGEHFAKKRAELRTEEMQERSLKRAIVARQRAISNLRDDMEKFLKGARLIIAEQDEQDIGLLYALDCFSGDLSLVLRLNKLLREVKELRTAISHDLNILRNMLDAAHEHFCPRNAELCAQEQMDYYCAGLDAMLHPMKKIWYDRIKDGYGPSLDGLLQCDDTEAPFFYVQKKLNKIAECPWCEKEAALLQVCANEDHQLCAGCLEKRNSAISEEGLGELSCPFEDCPNSLQQIRECPVCWDEAPLLQACENAAHQICVACLKGRIIVDLGEDKVEVDVEKNRIDIKCPISGCENMLKEVDYGRMLERGVFPYEFFEAYKARWLRHHDVMPKLARCCMGCPFYHEIPDDKIPGQASDACPDCGIKTCLSCKNLAHVGSLECKAPDAEAMKRAHELMFQAGFRACPVCGTWATKISGCDFVKCLCGQPFSFSTGKAWQSEQARQFGYHEHDVQAPLRINHDL